LLQLTRLLRSLCSLPITIVRIINPPLVHPLLGRSICCSTNTLSRKTHGRCVALTNHLAGSRSIPPFHFNRAASPVDVIPIAKHSLWMSFRRPSGGGIFASASAHTGSSVYYQIPHFVRNDIRKAALGKTRGFSFRSRSIPLGTSEARRNLRVGQLNLCVLRTTYQIPRSTRNDMKVAMKCHWGFVATITKHPQPPLNPPW
jgi:hypothetical protein